MVVVYLLCSLLQRVASLPSVYVMGVNVRQLNFMGLPGILLQETILSWAWDGTSIEVGGGHQQGVREDGSGERSPARGKGRWK